jgi:hypothetical protein
MDNSKFHLWRACFVFCSIDGVIEEVEKKWIKEKKLKLNFTPEQRKIISNDETHAPKISDLIPLITKKSDLGFLVSQMRVLASLDGYFHPEEEAKYKKIKEVVLGNIDLVALNEIIKEDERESYHEDEVYKVYNEDSIFEKSLRKIQKILNPGDYKFPSE